MVIPHDDAVSRKGKMEVIYFFSVFYGIEGILVALY